MSARPSVRRVFLALASLVAVVLISHAVTADPAQPVPQNAATAAGGAPPSAADVHEPIVEVSHSLRAASAVLYFVDVTLTNPSEASLAGPVDMVIDETGLEELAAHDAAGTADDKPFFRLLDQNETLAAGTSGRSQKVWFKSPRRLSPRARRDFELRYHLVTGAADAALQSPADTAAAPAPKIPKLPDAEELRKVMQVQNQWTDRLFERKGVVGTATGVDDTGRPVVIVLAERAGVADIPNRIDGVRVRVQVTGPLFARQRGPSRERGNGRGNGNRGRGSENGGGQDSDEDGSGSGGSGDEAGGDLPLPELIDPTDRFQRPVPIGVSIGNEQLCSAGTIACRVTDSTGKKYLLSNNHVLALSNTATAGDGILQPGRVDTGCAVSQGNVIGKLANFVEIQLGSGTNRVDAALAEVAAGDLDLSTPADGYGTPHTETATATLYQPVQKYGRTTRLTEGVVLAVNATVNVGYPGGTARFTNQIVVMGHRAGFLLAGDSGSLLVTKNGNRPVGLLFAGSLGGRFGVANRIGDVLSELNVTIDGGTGSQVTATTAGQ